jgi:tetratricopeptide (TPR) repeat protein
MLRFFGATVVVLLLALGGQSMADSPGQEDLDKATDAKVDAKTLKDLDEVVRLCESAKKKGLDPENLKFADQILGSALAQRGTVKTRAFFANPLASELRKQAQEDLEKAVTLDPKQPEAQLHLAQLYLLESDKRHALACLEQAIRWATKAGDIRAKALMMQSGLVEDAAKRRASLDEAVRIAPSDPAVLLAHGLLLADLGEFDKAMADLDKSIQLEPNRPRAHEAKAVLLARQKKYDQAMVSLDKARELEPQSTEPLMQEARIHSLQSNFNAAFHDLEQALQVNPDDLAVLLLRAGIYQEIGHPERALADIDRALKARPTLAIALRVRPLLLAAQGKLQQDVDELENFRQANPHDLPTLMKLAASYRYRGDESLAVGKHAEAIADYQRCLTFDPKDPGTLNNLAWVLATSPLGKIRDGKRAIQMATQAASLTDYKQAYILSTLAAAYAEAGDFKTALKWSEKAVEIGPADQKEGLKKEAASYKDKKPWRELLVAKKAEGKTEKHSGDVPKAAKSPNDLHLAAPPAKPSDAKR